MNLNKKVIYSIITIVYIILTVFELFEYYIADSSFFGLIYLIMNFVVVFFLSTVAINYNKADVKLRISKIFIALFLGFFASFILKGLIYSLLDYKIYSSSLETYIFLTKNIFKPIIYTFLLSLNLVEIDNVLKNNNKKGLFDLNYVKNIFKKIKKD